MAVSCCQLREAVLAAADVLAQSDYTKQATAAAKAVNKISALQKTKQKLQTQLTKFEEEKGKETPSKGEEEGSSSSPW